MPIPSHNLGALCDPETHGSTGGDTVAVIDLLDLLDPEAPREYTHREIDQAARAVARRLPARGRSLGDIDGQTPFAFVARAPDSTHEEDPVTRPALGHGPAFGTPRRVTFPERLPRAGPNKVDRQALEAQAAERARGA